MINDVVREFSIEPHLAFIDVDLFVAGPAWWCDCLSLLNSNTFALTAGLRRNRCMTISGEQFFPIKTNLFTLNTVAHIQLNEQRFNKDKRAIERLHAEYPNAKLEAPNIDTMIAASLGAQAHGLRVIDTDKRLDYCHVGGFSHLNTNKFFGYETPENRATIEAWLIRLRLLTCVLDHFLARGWAGFVDHDYRDRIQKARAFVASNPFLANLMQTVEASQHERVFAQLFSGEQ